MATLSRRAAHSRVALVALAPPSRCARRTAHGRRRHRVADDGEANGDAVDVDDDDENIVRGEEWRHTSARDDEMAVTRGARIACAWRGAGTGGDDGGGGGGAMAATSSAAMTGAAAPQVREFIQLRKHLSEELNVCASKKVSHAMTITIMRRTIPEGALVSALSEEDAKTPEEFVLVEFKNPDTRCVVCRGRRRGRSTGDGASDSGTKGTLTLLSSDQREVTEFMASSGVRFHRAAHRFVVAGDAFAAGDFILRPCRVESGSGAYVGTVLDLTYRGSDDASVAARALEEYAAYASASANEAGVGEGAFTVVDLRTSCPLDVYRAPAGELQLAISYVDALKVLRSRIA